MIKITGRYKELIIGAGGENVAPVPVEDGVKSRCVAISNIMMYGDKQKFNVAVVTLKTVGANGTEPGTDELDPVVQALDSSCTTLTEAMDSKIIIDAITKAITDTNNDSKCCPMPPAKIQKFTILPSDFSSSTNELTPTFKLKRTIVADKYMKNILGMYEAKDAYVKFSA
jgi:long-chain-fatty-acid--CoA ligase ACSBG